MELNERIALVRKAAGLTQAQLAEQLGQTQQTISDWESGQASPDAVAVARLCEALHVSADFVLLGKEPDGSGPMLPHQQDLPCPCCGRVVVGSVCAACGYLLPTTPDDGKRYAVLITWSTSSAEDEPYLQVIKYCNWEEGEAKDILMHMLWQDGRIVLRRNLPKSAAQWIASHIDPSDFTLQLVEDEGEDEPSLSKKQAALDLPKSAVPKEGLGFWGVVGAVIVALLILSFL